MDEDSLPASLLELCEFFHDELMPLAVRAGAASDGEKAQDLLRDHEKPGLPPGRDEIIFAMLVASIAYEVAKDPLRRCQCTNRYIEDAFVFTQYAYGYLSALAGVRGGAMSTLGTIGAAARHAENRDMKAQAIAWFRDNRASYRSKDAAALEIASRVLPVEFSTARRWLKNV